MLFNSHHWAAETDGAIWIYRLALDAIRGRQTAALTTTDTVRRREQLKWAIAGEHRKRLTNLLALAQNIRPLADAGDERDADPWLLGVENGVVELRTGALRAGRPDDRIAMCANAAFVADASREGYWHRRPQRRARLRGEIRHGRSGFPGKARGKVGDGQLARLHTIWLASLLPASWNQVLVWRKHIDALRQAG